MGEECCPDATSAPPSVNGQIASALSSGEPITAAQTDLADRDNGFTCAASETLVGASRAGTVTGGADKTSAGPAGNGASRAGTETPNGTGRVGTAKRRAERVNLLGLALAQYPDYNLVVTGHSLGAGTATILAFLLRSSQNYFLT
jgi:hypothetical protein